GAVVLSHPDQRRLLNEAGISLQGVPVIERPLGALTSFTPRPHHAARFCVGWVGRNHARKRLDWFVQAILKLGLAPAHLHVALIGAGLDAAAASLRASGVEWSLYEREMHAIATYPQLYQGLDWFVITSAKGA